MDLIENQAQHLLGLRPPRLPVRQARMAVVRVLHRGVHYRATGFNGHPGPIATHLHLRAARNGGLPFPRELKVDEDPWKTLENHGKDREKHWGKAKISSRFHPAACFHFMPKPGSTLGGLAPSQPLPSLVQHHCFLGGDLIRSRISTGLI